MPVCLRPWVIYSGGNRISLTCASATRLSLPRCRPPPSRPTGPTPAATAFGVEIARHRGLRTIGHGGGDEGRRTYVVRYPDQGLAVAVLCNLDDIDPATVSRAIAGLYLDNAFPEPARPQITDGSTPAAPVSVSPEELRSKVGLYRSVSDDSVGRIFIRDGKLIASETASDSGGYELTPIGANRFAIVETPMVAEFVPAAAGKPQELHVTGAGPKPMVSQLIAPFAPSNTQLRPFEGTYTSDEVHGTYTVVTRDSGLAIQIPGRSDISLQPLFTDAFGGHSVGVVKFSRDAHGVVTRFTMNASGIRGLRFNRAP
jgi:hypothetical protein